MCACACHAHAMRMCHVCMPCPCPCASHASSSSGLVFLSGLLFRKPASSRSCTLPSPLASSPLMIAVTCASDSNLFIVLSTLVISSASRQPSPLVSNCRARRLVRRVANRRAVAGAGAVAGMGARWNWSVRTRLGEELPQLVVLLSFLAWLVVEAEVGSCGRRWPLNLWEVATTSEHLHDLGSVTARQSGRLCRQDPYAGVSRRAAIQVGRRHLEESEERPKVVEIL